MSLHPHLVKSPALSMSTSPLSSPVNVRRKKSPFVALVLMLAFTGHAADMPAPAEEKASYAEQMVEYRDAQLALMHEALGIRNDQAALWKQVEQRLAPLFMGSVQIRERARTVELSRELDKHQLMNDSAKQQVSDQRLMLGALRWLYPHLDAQQRRKVDGMAPDIEPGDYAQFAAGIMQARSDWPEQRATLRQDLDLRPDQLAAWKQFEQETASPVARTLAFVQGGPPAAQPPLAQLENMNRMQDLVAQDTDDWLATLRRLERVLDTPQKAVLDTFLTEHGSPLQ